MAANPALDPHGMPVPFVGEVVVLMRRGIEFHVDNVPRLGGAKWASKGVLYLTSVRLVFVSSSPPPPGPNTVAAFDMPLLFVRGEKFNQPIFGCNNISGKVLPVQSEDAPTVQLPHNFSIYFTEGGVGTFLPLFSSVLRTLRATNPALAGLSASSTTETNREEGQQSAAASPVSIDPVPCETPARALEAVRSAYMDPNDPTVVYVQQPASFSSEVKRRTGYTTKETQA